MAIYEGGNLYFENEEILEKLTTLSRELLITNLELNGKSADFVERPSPKLTLYTQKNEELVIELAYFMELLTKMYYKAT